MRLYFTVNTHYILLYNTLLTRGKNKYPFLILKFIIYKKYIGVITRNTRCIGNSVILYFRFRVAFNFINYYD